jgi:TetR/AcrR family transcriptional regulator, repressor for uid operon
MPKVLPEYLELKRQEILDGAAACFARSGFHGTTMQDICSEVNLSPGAVYRYFQSKEEIIQAMCTRGHEEDVVTIREAMRLDSTLKTFDELIRIFFSGVEDREFCALMVELISEARHNELIGDSVRDGWVQIMEPLKELVVDAQGRGEMNPKLDPAAVVRVMLGVYQGLVLQNLLQPGMDVEGYALTVRALFNGTFWTGGSPAALPSDMQSLTSR